MGVHELLDRNAEFAKSFDQGDLGIPPRLSTLIVTCLDARVDPAHFLDLELGDAFVMRNVGGRVTEELIEQLAIMRGLTSVAGGADFAVMVVHHTDCGGVRFADPDIREKLGRASGVSDSTIQGFAASDPRLSVREDLERLRAAPVLPDDIVVAGYVYDVTAGRLETVSEPAPLREGGQ